MEEVYFGFCPEEDFLQESHNQNQRFFQDLDAQAQKFESIPSDSSFDPLDPEEFDSVYEEDFFYESNNLDDLIQNIFNNSSNEKYVEKIKDKVQNMKSSNFEVTFNNELNFC